METCYKTFRREIIQKIKIEENRFGFEPEITAKVARLKVRIYEVAISYHGRTYAEGKKIGWRDGFHALWCIFKYNFLRWPTHASRRCHLGLVLRVSDLRRLDAVGAAPTERRRLCGRAADRVCRRCWSGEKKPPARFPRIAGQNFAAVFAVRCPAIFLLLASLVFLGGVLYAPNNYDALTYRLPRMLNWLAAGQWFWIPTINERMNYSTTGLGMDGDAVAGAAAFRPRAVPDQRASVFC